jgi:hypothetical protein
MRKAGGLEWCAAYRCYLRVRGALDNTVDVAIPVDAEAARAFESPARREKGASLLSNLLKGGHVRDVLAEAIAEAKREGARTRPDERGDRRVAGRAAGLTII